MFDRLVDYIREPVRKELRDCLERQKELRKKLEEKDPDVDDSEYWNNKWEKKDVTYNTGRTKDPTQVFELKEEEEQQLIAQAEKIIGDYKLRHRVEEKGNWGVVPISVLKWRWKYFEGRSYEDDDELYGEEYWAPAIKTLKKGKGDCDDYAVLEYCMIRLIFQHFGLWHKLRHRLKFVAGNVNNSRGRYSGAHAYLIWLAEDGRWYTIETTYNVPHSINAWKKLPHEADQRYGTMWFTCNEEHAWAQFDPKVSRKEFDI